MLGLPALFSAACPLVPEPTGSGGEGGSVIATVVLQANQPATVVLQGERPATVELPGVNPATVSLGPENPAIVALGVTDPAVAGADSL